MVYCQDYRRVKKKSFGKKFDFLGFTFKPSSARGGGGRMFLSYGCVISQSSQTRIIERWKEQNWHRRSTLTLQDIANLVNEQMRGIIRYYGKFKIWQLQSLMWHFEQHLVKWVLNKYRRFRNSYKKAHCWLKALKQSYPAMFYYWTVFKHV